MNQIGYGYSRAPAWVLLVLLILGILLFNLIYFKGWSTDTVPGGVTGTPESNALIPAPVTGAVGTPTPQPQLAEQLEATVIALNLQQQREIFAVTAAAQDQALKVKATDVALEGERSAIRATETAEAAAVRQRVEKGITAEHRERMEWTIYALLTAGWMLVIVILTTAIAIRYVRDAQQEKEAKQPREWPRGYRPAR